MRVLLIDIDSLRPDHLGCYGYDRNTSPVIDSLAEDGVAFENCFASDTPCLPSRTAMASCRFGIKNGVVTHFGNGQWYDEPGEGHSQDPDRPLSFRHLSQNGLDTASVSIFTQRHLAYHYGAGFDESIRPDGYFEPAVTAAATEWLDRNASDDDWLFHVNYWDVHHPYQGVDPYVEEVRESGDRPAWPDQETIDGQQGMTGPRTAASWPTASEYREDGHRTGKYGEWPFPDRIEDCEDVEYLFDGYDAAIRKVDDAVETLLGKLEEAGVREETAVVVTADHGDAFGEHGIYVEHGFAHPPTQRIPMIVSWPGVTDEAAGETVDGHVYQFDLLPTICDLAGVDVPAGWDADSFTAALEDGDFAGRDFLVCGHGIFTHGRAVYEGDWMYVKLLHPGILSNPGLFNDPDLPGDGLELLHDLDADPHMTENLIDERPAKADEMRARLATWTTEQLESADCEGHDPLVEMASTDGPYLYADPADMIDLFRETGRDDAQVDAMIRSLRERPYAGAAYPDRIDTDAEENW